MSEWFPLLLPAVFFPIIAVLLILGWREDRRWRTADDRCMTLVTVCPKCGADVSTQIARKATVTSGFGKKAAPPPSIVGVCHECGAYAVFDLPERRPA